MSKQKLIFCFFILYLSFFFSFKVCSWYLQSSSHKNKSIHFRNSFLSLITVIEFNKTIAFWYFGVIISDNFGITSWRKSKFEKLKKFMFCDRMIKFCNIYLHLLCWIFMNYISWWFRTSVCCPVQLELFCCIWNRSVVIICIEVICWLSIHELQKTIFHWLSRIFTFY